MYVMATARGTVTIIPIMEWKIPCIGLVKIDAGCFSMNTAHSTKGINSKSGVSEPHTRAAPENLFFLSTRFIIKIPG